MYRRIVAPLDGSKMAELALPYARRLAEIFHSELVLLSVSEPEESEYRQMQQLYVERMADLIRRDLGEWGAIDVKPVLVCGDPATEIISYVEQNDVDLLVMASHGRSGIMAWAMGGVAFKVLQRTRVPLMLVKATSQHRETAREGIISRVLVPLDGSKLGEIVLPHIEELGAKAAIQVILLQVVPRGVYTHTVGGLNYVPFKEPMLKSMTVEAEKYLCAVAERLKGTSAMVSHEVRIGDVAEEIIKSVDQAHIDLVAMSTHGHSGIKGWIMGNVTYKVVHASPRPLLLVRALSSGPRV